MLTRKRRAAPSDIYPQCKISNTCPPDILNKYEQSTLADKILKYGSAGVFLGSLGIGTAKGTGGGTGYVPLGGGGVRLGTRVTTIRPTLPISSLGPSEVIPVDAIDPLGPAIIPPERFPTAVEDPFTISPPRFPSIIEEGTVTISTTESTVTELPLSTPKITTDEQPAILEVTPETRSPRIISRTQYSNPTFEVSLTTTSGSGEASFTDHIVVEGHSGGQLIGEQIPLRDLSSRSFDTTIQEETAFTTSTPRADAPPDRPPHYYNRRLQQIKVTDPDFITRPRALVTFENPTFEESVDLIFNQDIADLAQAAPNEDFRDLVTLSRPYYSRTDLQGVRVSRFGQKASIRTRSGLTIGPQSHYYYDISDVAPAENIELTPIGNFPLGEQSGEAVITLGTDDFDVVSLAESLLETYSDEFLLDEIESIANDLQLVIGSRREQQPISVPNLIKPSPQVFPDFEGVHVKYPSDSDNPLIPLHPESTPAISFDIYGDGLNFYLHPSLLRKKRRKRYFY
ncbi:L2 [Canis familiaris papillomavirus 6]|uniref:Minor capsid protein L2 n=1 Tax=Canis familiaris papillomavirus 6 TaxID=1513269 RepID=C8YJL7_9PAPI|nr:L2 [Canis familiaris papillomavirus 6]ACU27460.1 L2 [Canis familiaris papillomavirus 6]AVI56947.1 late protein 2 [Canis familiaris papillomavirus 6]